MTSVESAYPAPSVFDAFSGIFGIRSFVHTQAAPNSVQLPLKKNGTKSLAQLVNDEVPYLREGAWEFMSPALFNGDLQTLYSSTPHEHVWQVYYGRRCIYWEDGSLVTADYRINTPASQTEWKELTKYSPLGDKTPPLPKRLRYLAPEEVAKIEAPSPSVADKPLLVLLHGLSGGSHEPYIRGIVDMISRPENGFDCVVLNSRGCARTPITTPQLFCGAWTEDIRQFIKLLRKEQPESRRIYLIGFSLGASVLANYLGQDGELLLQPESRVDAAMVIANPWDLALSSHKMATSFMGRTLYNPSMKDNLVRLIKNHHTTLASNPEFDYEKRKTLKNIEDFDNAYTAPLFGFDSARDYYRNGSSVLRIMNIRVPTVIINALDDPVVHKDCIPYVEAFKNPYLVLSTTSLGGHLGWTQPGTGNNWLPKAVSKFFKKFDEAVDHEKGVPLVQLDRPKRRWNGDRLI